MSPNLLTEKEQYNILRHLGYPWETLKPNSIYYTHWVVDRFSTAPAPVIEIIRSLLARIDSIDTELTSSIGRAKVENVGGDIALNSREMMLLRSERRKVINELATILELD